MPYIYNSLETALWFSFSISSHPSTNKPQARGPEALAHPFLRSFRLPPASPMGSLNFVALRGERTRPRLYLAHMPSLGQCPEGVRSVVRWLMGSWAFHKFGKWP